MDYGFDYKMLKKKKRKLLYSKIPMKCLLFSDFQSQIQRYPIYSDMRRRKAEDFHT